MKASAIICYVERRERDKILKRETTRGRERADDPREYSVSN